MHSKWVFKHFSCYARSRILLLFALWVTGLLVGILLCSFGSLDHGAVLRSVVVGRPSPIGLLLVCVLPVALTVIALQSPLIVVLYPAVFLNAVSHSFCGSAIYIAQGSAAWLLRPMLLFPSCCAAVLMWWLILQSESKYPNRKNTRLAFIISGIVYIVDLFVVSPLIGDLSKYF